MKIVHICLSCFYIDKMAYQENLLPKYHALEHEVTIITSDYSFDAHGQTVKKEQTEYFNEHGIKVFVLQRSKRYGIYSKLNDFDGLFTLLTNLTPDIVFCHGGQFVALKDVIRYCRKNKKVKLYIDQHGDYYNTPLRTIKSKIVYQGIYGYWMRKAVPYTTKFWGVTPWRCEYLHDVYRIPRHKIDLLIMGGDDEKIRFNRRENIRKEIRKAHNISEDDFLLVTGGKIDEAKKIHLLIEAVKSINQNNIKLLIFGQASKAFEEHFLPMIEDEHIRYIGWIPSEQVYDYFLASDMCVFPGTHSVLWEQACACGIPGIFRDWEGMHHVDVGGNAIFLTEDSAEEIASVLTDLYQNTDKFVAMKNVAQSKCITAFSYREIAKKAISEGN